MKTISLTLVVILLFIAGVVLLGGVLQNQKPSQSETGISSSPTSIPQAEEVDLKASFQIITKGIVRSFKNPKYHLRSADVYLLADDSTIVHVKRIGITWDDFFKTLPMKLTKDCLTTGDGETFCSGSAGTLRFYLNDLENQNLLDVEIKEGDKALIKF
ncbi:hypothetical protein HYW39_00465 [Candidatus Curtissbacteria bacterium]|nr:hypothetical protein [Candidatus Curtissbacteria bacterium]